VWRFLGAAGLAVSVAVASAQSAPLDGPRGEDGMAWSAAFDAEVDRRLEVPAAAREAVIALTEAALAQAGLPTLVPQYVVVVDRNPQVQALFVLLRTPLQTWYWVGATPVSTGRVGEYDHFRTPLGVFDHLSEHGDFRAEGTFNANGIRGYGVRGMRVFDFGWVVAERGWGRGGSSPMRLQVHATDPARLEPRLGRVASKGCIRIPASLNIWLDRRGILDAVYERALATGAPLWVLRADRQPTPWSGRYLVVVESAQEQRPDWSPAPRSLKAQDARPLAVPC
jgi:hypothetical protein